MAGHPGADSCHVVLLAYLERLDDVLVLGLHFAPPRTNGLVTGIRLALILDDGIGREGVDQGLAVVPLVRVEIGLDR